MRTLLFIILLVIFSFLSCLYFPWWSIAIVAFLMACLLPQKPGTAFFAAFVAMFVFWFVFSMVISINNDHILAKRASALIMNIENAWFFMLMTGLIGGLVSGVSALSASYLFLPAKSPKETVTWKEE